MTGNIDLGFIGQPTTQEELDEDVRGWEQSCRDQNAELEAKWKAEGKTTIAWFSKEPDFCKGCLSWFWIDDPKEPCKRIYRFSLIGGGQVATVEDWRWRSWPSGRKKDQPYPAYTWRDDDTCLTYDLPHHRLIVKAHTPEGLTHYRGEIGGHSSEISASAAVFPKGVPQEIADRVAATLSAIGCDEDAFYALLDSSEGCAMCGRPLRDEVSKLVGVGPSCAKEHRIPHSMEAANRRLELRRQILGEQITH